MSKSKDPARRRMAEDAQRMLKAAPPEVALLLRATGNDGRRYNRLTDADKAAISAAGYSLEVFKYARGLIAMRLYLQRNRQKQRARARQYRHSASGKAAQTASYLNAASDILGASKTWESLGGGSTPSTGGKKGPW